MAAPPTLEERVTTVEDTLKQLITSLQPPDSALKKIDRDIQKLTRTTGVAHGCILELVTESEEVQELQKKTIETVTEHGRELAEHRRELAEHGRELTEIKATLNEHGNTLSEHSREFTEIKTMLRDLGGTLNGVVTRLDER